MTDKTDWNRLQAMTEEEIVANALSDPDNPPLTDEQLAKAVRIKDIPGETLGEKLRNLKKMWKEDKHDLG